MTNAPSDPHDRPSGPGAAPPAVSDEVKAKARRFFDHAKKAAEGGNYDYAVKLYADGLAVWPDAVDEGLRPLRVTAMARKLEGGKAMGFLAARKLPTTGKDPLVNLNNALHLFGLDPSTPANVERILSLAVKARQYRIAWWVAPLLVEIYDTCQKKMPESHYENACKEMNEAAALAVQTGEDRLQMELLQACIAVTQIWVRCYPNSMQAQRVRGDASGLLTITRGKFSREDGFTESLKDAEGQADIRDRDRSTITDDRLKMLIERARQDWEQNREVSAKLINLVELMVRTELPAQESEAVSLLEHEYQSGGNYTFRMKADDIRMKQANRRLRQAVEHAAERPADAASRKEAEALAAQVNDLEIHIYEDRRKMHPTDMKYHFNLGVRYFKAGRFDDAIPMFQKSQLDGRYKSESLLYLGRCFLEKGFFEQALGTLRKGAQDLGGAVGKLACELNYWLGRTFEQMRRFDDAREAYGQIIQIDYNYRDARRRLEKIVSGGG